MGEQDWRLAGVDEKAAHIVSKPYNRTGVVEVQSGRRLPPIGPLVRRCEGLLRVHAGNGRESRCFTIVPASF